LPVAIGLKIFSTTGAFIGPLTMPHLSKNALTGSGAVVWVCLIDFDFAIILSIGFIFLYFYKNIKTLF
jgi:hypothetical protein